ncbi:MAG: nicotinamide mononucleotide transporter [Gammaproteobacteria bacterium]|nr:nicotinamide mononucleotide transporter [Gammaproteobacteria bacterium]
MELEVIETIVLWLESASTVVGVLTVLCLIYEKYWAWPLGVLFCFLSAPVLLHNNLYGYLTLTLVGFLPMNIYGWYYWIAGTEHKTELPVTKAPVRIWLVCGVLSLVAILLLPYFFALIVPDYFETAEYIYLDNSILVLSLSAMWFTARKFIENWFIWLVVNFATVALYGLTDLYQLMLLYVAYIGMAFWGYRQWRISMRKQKITPAPQQVVT